MKSTSTNTSFINTYPSSFSKIKISFRAEKIAICSVFVIEAILIVGGNLLTIVLFVLEKKQYALRKVCFKS